MPQLPTDRIARHRWGRSWRLTGQNGKHRDNLPLVVIDTVRNAIRIVAMETDRRLDGIRVDQTLSDARAINPNLDCIHHDPYTDMALLKRIARWCERYTPLVALNGSDGLFLDITGCTHLFGGETKLLDDMATRFNAQGLDARLAIADTAGAAWAISRYGERKIALPNSHRELLEPMPLSALRLPESQVRELSKIGYKTVGCLLGLPRAPIVARFGQEILQRLDQAMGHEDEVLSPIQPVAELVSEKRFPEPICYEEDIKATIKLLAQNLVPGLEKRSLGMRQCELVLFRADGEIVSLTVEASSPLRDASRITALFDERLAALHDEWDAGFGFDVIRLSVLRTDRLDAKQQDMVCQDLGYDVFSHLVDRLSVRLGTDRVRIYQMVDTHIPERRFGLASAIHHKPANISVPAKVAEIAVCPLLLFNRPEPADVMAEVPEGPPVHFRWRKAQYQVVRSEGPERIACEWWKDGRAAHTRDYFRVETQDGYRLWLFRHGLYIRETDIPKWYVHGMFA
ncbi:MAG: DNA polymerase Y family protein [Rhizobiaceae bacterium]